MNVMKNNITIEEIKESVEYHWRKNQIIILLYAWLLVAGISLIVPFAVIIDSFELVGMGFLIWLFWMLFIGLFIFVAILFYLNKNWKTPNSKSANPTRPNILITLSTITATIPL